MREKKLRMKRVLVVAEWIDLSGGVTRTLLDLLRGMDPAEFDVELYVMRPGESELSAVPHHVRVIANDFDLPYLQPGQVLKRLIRTRKIGSSLSYAATVMRWKLNPNRGAYMRFFAKRHPRPSSTYDVVVAYAMLDSYSNQYVAERVEAPRKIMWCHTVAELYTDRQMSGLGSVLKRFDAINCVSKEAKRSLQRRFPALGERLRVRYNTVGASDIVRLSNEPVAALARRPGVIVLTTVARISHEKGIDLLVDTAVRLKNQGHQFLWWVVGPDFDSDYAVDVKGRCVREGLSESVRFVGGQENPYPYMSICDIYVQPSRIEGFGMTTAEAKLLHKPVIRTSTAGAEEQFEHGVNGSVVAATADDISTEVERLINFPDVREAYRRALQAESLTPQPSVASLLS